MRAKQTDTAARRARGTEGPRPRKASSGAVSRRRRSGATPRLEPELTGDLAVLDELAKHQGREVRRAPRHIAVDPEKVEQGLAQLVLTLVELIRQLLERQALRRVEAGSLTDAQVERMGETLLKLEEKMTELKKVFGLRDEDLNLDLGPLGRLL